MVTGVVGARLPAGAIGLGEAVYEATGMVLEAFARPDQAAVAFTELDAVDASTACADSSADPAAATMKSALSLMVSPFSPACSRAPRPRLLKERTGSRAVLP